MQTNRLNLRNVIAIAISLAVASVTFTACNKDDAKKDGLNITAINSSSSKIVTKQLKSTEEKSFPIDCYALSTSTFDTRNHSYGYMGCDNFYHFIDAETGVKTRQIPLPTMLNLVVLDTTRNLLIGQRYDFDYNEGKDYVVTIDLNSGNVVSDKPFYVEGLWNISVHFFRDVENEYVLLHPYDGLVFINPSTGDVIRTLSMETMCISNMVYDKKNNRLIGTTCIDDMGDNYIVAIDLQTGNTLSKVLGEGMGANFSFFADEMDYDAETDSYILVSANNEVLFFDVATGKVKERYQLGFSVTSLKLWRSGK